MTTQRPSHDNFAHNSSLIDSLDRYTSSLAVVPLSGPPRKEVRAQLQKYQLSNRGRFSGLKRCIATANDKYHRDLAAGRAAPRETAPDRRRSIESHCWSHLFPYLDDDFVDHLKESHRLEWLASVDRESLCFTNARDDILASAKGKGLRLYLEALHRNTLILEKRIAVLEAQLDSLSLVPTAIPL